VLWCAGIQPIFLHKLIISIENHRQSSLDPTFTLHRSDVNSHIEKILPPVSWLHAVSLGQRKGTNSSPILTAVSLPRFIRSLQKNV